MNRTVGIIEGEGVGREIVRAAQLCLCAVQELRHEHLKLRLYTGRVQGADAERELTIFYKQMRDAGGVILRASIPAPVCYRLRREFDLFYKLIPFRVDPALARFSPLKPERIRDLDLLLVRQNNQGFYHGQFEPLDHRVRCEQYYDVTSIRRLAEVAFLQAASRRRRLRLLMKDEVLGPLGVLWRETFSQAALRHPEVRYDLVPPDSGSAQILLAPWAFDVVVAGDIEGDMLADQLAVLVHGTRAATPSVNCDDSGFASYQTIHGTAKGLAGKNIANPAGMIVAAAWMLGRSFGWHVEAARLRTAVFDVLSESLTSVPTDQHNADLVLESIGTARFAELVCARLLSHEVRQAA